VMGWTDEEEEVVVRLGKKEKVTVVGIQNARRSLCQLNVCTWKGERGEDEGKRDEGRE